MQWIKTKADPNITKATKKRRRQIKSQRLEENITIGTSLSNEQPSKQYEGSITGESGEATGATAASGESRFQWKLEREF